MARSTYGGEVAHLVVTADATNANALITAPNATVPLFNSLGVQQTDFLLWDGSAFATAVTSIVTDANGVLPLFQGPDGLSVLYDSAGAALRSREEQAGGGSTVQTVAGQSPDGNGNVALTQDHIPSGSAAKQFTNAKDTKLTDLPTRTELDTSLAGKSDTSHTHGTGTATFNAQTGTAYTFVLSDAGKVVTADNASAQTYTVPTNATAAIPVGSQIEVLQLGAGQVTIAAASGVTLRSRDNALKAAGQFAMVGLLKIATDTWAVMGDVTV